MKTNLFIMLPFQSHFYPSFGFANELQKKGQKIIYTTTQNLNEIVSNEGFEFRELKYMSEYTIRNFKSFVGIFLKNLLDKGFINERKQDFKLAFDSLINIINSVRPSQIFIDQHLAEYYLLLKPFVHNITIIHTKLYTGKRKGIPPLNSKYVPKHNKLSDIFIDILWNFEFVKSNLKVLLEKIAFLGIDEKKIFDSYCQEKGINRLSIVDNTHFLNNGIKNIENIVLTKQILEYPSKDKNLQLSYKFIPYTRNEKKFLTKKYIETKQIIIGNNRSTVIYIAFGTLSGDHKIKIEKLINNVIDLYEMDRNVFLVISKGNIELEIRKSPNIFTFDFVPQQDILKYANIFITHGGLGSITEALTQNVPMLVVPINKKVDQIGNAKRVEFNLLGHFLDIDKYSKNVLISKLNHLINRDLQINNNSIKIT